MAGPETEPIGSSSRSWASVTFTGAQHEFELFLMGKDAHDRANKLAECLPEAEFVVAGHIVVDATVDRPSRSQGGAGEPLAAIGRASWRGRVDYVGVISGGARQ